MPTFVRSVDIEAPVDEVFAFHERDDALPLLSPAFPPVRIASRTGGLQAGARVDLRIGPIRWLALHTAYERNRVFVDEQVSGPFAAWVHRHEFDDLGGRTRLTDRVSFQLKGGPLVNALFGGLVAWALTPMFRHRHAVTKRYCEGRRPS